jgi:hypothetical protein
VLVAPASNAYEVVVEAEAPVRQSLAIDVNGKGLGIASNLTFNSSQPIKVTVRMPEGVLQYTEINFVNSDLLVNVTFSKSKGEIVKRGNGTMVISGLNSDLAKFSVAG